MATTDSGRVEMKIAVLIKQVPDTWSDRVLQPDGRVDRSSGNQVIDEVDERALELALSHRDRTVNTEVVVITMGPESAGDALKTALATGADSAIHVLDPELNGADARFTAKSLSAVIARGQFDLVIAGNISTDGRGGVLPAMIAEHLKLAHVTCLDEVTLSESRVSGVRTIEGRTQRLHARLPAVVSVTERMPPVRFPSFRGIMAAKKKKTLVMGLSELAVERPPARSVILSSTERPPRTKGTVIIDDGTAATQLADFLSSRGLLETSR
jgi:electron transfer flavoprotein beta subunit